MPCLTLPTPPGLPPLPPGVSIPLFPGLALPSLGLCCKIRYPPYPVTIPNVVLAIPFPSAVVTAYMEAQDALENLYDLAVIPCPSE